MFLRSRIRRLWTDSLRFHGKPCTLLALGVRVCDTAMTHLGLSDPGRDRLVCVSEHDGCCVDAIQIGLHCTSGRAPALLQNRTAPSSRSTTWNPERRSASALCRSWRSPSRP